MKLVDKTKVLGVRTNADTPKDAAQALAFGAEGMVSSEQNMFYGEGSDRPLFLLRKMIMSKTESERRSALKELFRHLSKRHQGYPQCDEWSSRNLQVARPATARVWDSEKLHQLSKELGISMSILKRRVLALHEKQPDAGSPRCEIGHQPP